MKVFLLGEGCGSYDLRKICLDRGVQILGFIDPKSPVTFRSQMATLPLEEAAKNQADLVIIANPKFAIYQPQLLAMGLPPENILLFYENIQRSLDRIGPVTHFAVRRRGTTNEYLVHTLQGKFTEDTRSHAYGVEDARLASLLLAMFRACKEALENEDPLYRAGTNWGNFLKATRGALYAAMETGDGKALTAALANFWRNGLGEGIIAGEAAYRGFCAAPEAAIRKSIHPYLTALTQGLGTDFDPSDLELPLTGNAFGIRLEGRLIQENTIMNYYRAGFIGHLLEDLPTPVVAEIGGGVGYFAHSLLKQNPRMTYIDFDLPETLIVEAYFLAKNFPDRRILLFDGSTLRLTQDVLEAYDIILMPTHMVSRLDDAIVDLFLNTISFGEMSPAITANYLKQIDRTTRRFFYHENLSEVSWNFENYPGDLFSIPKHFKQLFSGPSRWPFFAPSSPNHSFSENLYLKHGQVI